MSFGSLENLRKPSSASAFTWAFSVDVDVLSVMVASGGGRSSSWRFTSWRQKAQHLSCADAVSHPCWKSPRPWNELSTQSLLAWPTEINNYQYCDKRDDVLLICRFTECHFYRKACQRACFKIGVRVRVLQALITTETQCGVPSSGPKSLELTLSTDRQ